MTHVSKRKIENKNFKKIYGQLIELIEKSGSNRSGSKFLKELFSPAEKIMFAKRIGMIILIHNRVPDRTIASLLSVSTSTIGRIIEKYDKGDYEYIVSTFKKDDIKLGKILEFLLTGILPPRAGMGRYNWLGKF